MAIIKYKPTSPARRFMTVTDYSVITTNEPEKSLTTDLRHRGRPQRPGKDHRPPSGRRRQAEVSDHRL